MKRYAAFLLVGTSVLLLLAAACGGGGATATPRSTSSPTSTPSATATGTPRATPTPTGAVQTPTGDLVARGKLVFTGAAGCAACHTIQGISPANPLAPELTHIATVAATRKPNTSAEAYIRESIENPNAFVVPQFAPVMPPTIRQLLSLADYEAVVAFLLAQK